MYCRQARNIVLYDTVLSLKLVDSSCGALSVICSSPLNERRQRGMQVFMAFASLPPFDAALVLQADRGAEGLNP